MKPFHTNRLSLLGLFAGGALLVACGADEKAPPNLAPFVGTWNIGEAAALVTCSVGGSIKNPIVGTVNIAKGLGADLAMTFTDPSLTGCTVRFNVQSDASAVPLVGEKCVVALPAISGTLTISSGTFGVLANTGNLSLKGGAVAKFGNLDLTCTGDVTGMLTRGAPTDAGADAL